MWKGTGSSGPDPSILFHAIPVIRLFLDVRATGCVHRAILGVVEPILLREWLCSGRAQVGWEIRGSR